MDKGIRIAVLSGKGGVGKTLVSVNLACALGKCTYVDCDIEEPNGSLFFSPSVFREESVTVKVPYVDMTQCSSCRKCSDFCKFNAIAFINDRPYIFEDICHSCGGCALICPNNAVKERDRRIGIIQTGSSESVTVYSGTLDIGEATGVPIVRELMNRIILYSCNEPIIIDCPPGSGCTVSESIRNADFCLLICEPTVFSAHNIKMVCELAKLYNKPCGVILNKYTAEDYSVDVLCNELSVPILGTLPFDSELGALSSEGKIAYRAGSKYQKIFSDLCCKVIKEVQGETASYTQR